MNIKPLIPAVFAVCLLLGYGPVASAQAEKRTEPADSTETDESGEPSESWTSGAPSPDDDSEAERRAEEEVVDNLKPVDPDKTRPSPGQARPDQANLPRSAADKCLASTIEAVLAADRAGSGAELSVDAQGGVVSLSGTLTDQASIERVRTLVASVKGVNRVDASGLTSSGQGQARKN